jgi:hypothetical protein
MEGPPSERAELVRRQEELHRSLDHTHTETAALTEEGFAEWAANLPEETEPPFDASLAKPVRWIVGPGWLEDYE